MLDRTLSSSLCHTASCHAVNAAHNRPRANLRNILTHSIRVDVATITKCGSDHILRKAPKAVEDVEGAGVLGVEGTD